MLSMETRPWAEGAPSNEYMMQVLVTVALATVIATGAFRASRDPAKIIEQLGVSARKVQRALHEIERKSFHIAGLLVPLTHMSLLAAGWSNQNCVTLCWVITVTGWVADICRLHIPIVARHWPMRHILREHEMKQLTGGCYFSLGCTLAISISPPSIAAASILFLVLGDMSAALIGVSFGGEVSVVKLGRGGKKSLEGSVAMFCICFLIGALPCPRGADCSRTSAACCLARLRPRGVVLARLRLHRLCLRGVARVSHLLGRAGGHSDGAL